MRIARRFVVDTAMSTPTCHRCRAPLDSLSETTCPECRREVYLDILRYREFPRADLGRLAAADPPTTRVPLILASIPNASRAGELCSLEDSVTVGDRRQPEPF